MHSETDWAEAVLFLGVGEGNGSSQGVNGRESLWGNEAKALKTDEICHFAFVLSFGVYIVSLYSLFGSTRLRLLRHNLQYVITNAIFFPDFHIQ